MKKRSKVLAVLLCMTMAAAVGCGGKEDAKEDKTDTGAGAEKEEQVSESDEYLALIKEAFQQYNAEGIHGYKEESTSLKEDGSSETTISVHTIDKDLQQVLDRYVWDAGVESNSWYTKEGENEYYYTEITSIYDDTGDEEKTCYKVLTNGQEDAITYSDYIEGEEGNRYESGEYYDVSNVNVTSEGEEELDGVKVQKFKVEYDSQWKGREKMSRESLLEEYEWTEEDVAQLEGMSDAIDAYVEESNAYSEKEMEKVDHTTEFVYLTSEDNKLARLETEYDYDDEDLTASKTFWNMSGKLNYLKELLSQGLGKDEALNMANEVYSEDADMEEESPAVSNTSVTTYLTGDACEPIGLPADAAEITWEQWENGDY